jgi:hypothetical protein
MRREISGEIEKQRGGHPKVLGEQEKRLCVGANEIIGANYSVTTPFLKPLLIV